MTYRLKILTTAAVICFAGLPVYGQGQLPATKGGATAQADFIVAVVNSEPITNNEVQREVRRVQQQFAQQRSSVPDARKLSADVLESLINNKAQLQFAHDTGIRVEESAIDQAEQSIALQNQFDVAELRRRIVRDGMTVEQFRTQLREQITLQRLRERDVVPRVRVSEQEIDRYLNDQQGGQDLNALELNLAQILVAVPEAATPEQVTALQAQAQKVFQRARAGDDFSALVGEYSDANRANGGQMGLRSAERYPPLFVQATRSLAVGDVAALVRSPAGFHILKVVEKVNADLPAMFVTQNHARHILLLPGANLSEAQARERLAGYKLRVQSGQADFAALARQYSQDGSAANGGDLGWSDPGLFVPEFEDAVNRLAPGEISEPVVSRFGVHLIQLLERRKQALSAEQQREAVRATLRDKKLEETYRLWAQDLRDRAYVEMREPPL